MDFLLGAAIIAIPQHQIPLAAGTAAWKVTTAFLRQRNNGSSRSQHDSGLNMPQDSTESAGSANLGAAGTTAEGSNSTRCSGQPVTVRWQDLTCALAVKGGGKRVLLEKLDGEALPGRLLAIMGPSGSGKTTLLNTLAGQVPASGKLDLSGLVTLNGQLQQEARVQQGYVQQEDLFFSMLTVRETMTLAAELRLEASMCPEERVQYVEQAMQQLGLSKCADSTVGDAKTRGLSGGEKKRLQIACELIGSPRLVFADEPTTGLDAFQAEKVMQALKDLAKDGHTVVASIHQPRSSIFAMFDDVLLMAEGGREVYLGPAGGMLQYFEAMGYPCPGHYNPAEFVSDLIAADYSSPEALEESRKRIDELVAAYAKDQKHKVKAKAAQHHELASGHVETAKPRRGVAGQFRFLLWQPL